MRRLLFALSIVLLFGSCNFPEYYHFTVKNESSKNVSYTFNGTHDHTLAPGEEKSYQTQAGARFTGVGNVSVEGDYGFGYRVLLKKQSTADRIKYIFINNEPFNLHVANSLPIDVTIRAGNFIYNNGRPILTIDAHSSIDTAKIYTSTPSFILLSEPFSVIFDWNFDKDTVYLVIR